MAFGVFFNSKFGPFHSLHYENIADDGHYRSRSGRSHPQGTNFGRMSCAQAYIRFAGKRTVRIAGDDNEFQARIQVVGQLG